MKGTAQPTGIPEGKVFGPPRSKQQEAVLLSLPGWPSGGCVRQLRSEGNLAGMRLLLSSVSGLCGP